MGSCTPSQEWQSVKKQSAQSQTTSRMGVARQSRTRSSPRKRGKLCKTKHWLWGRVISQTGDQRPQRPWPKRKLPCWTSQQSQPPTLRWASQGLVAWGQKESQTMMKQTACQKQQSRHWISKINWTWQSRNKLQWLHDSIDRCWRILPISQTEISFKNNKMFFPAPARRRPNQHQTLLVFDQVWNSVNSTCFCGQMLWVWLWQNPGTERANHRCMWISLVGMASKSLALASRQH